MGRSVKCAQDHQEPKAPSPGLRAPQGDTAYVCSSSIKTDDGFQASCSSSSSIYSCKLMMNDTVLTKYNKSKI